MNIICYKIKFSPDFIYFHGIFTIHLFSNRIFFLHVIYFYYFYVIYYLIFFFYTNLFSDSVISTIYFILIDVKF